MRHDRHMTGCAELLRDAFARSSEALGRVLGGIGDEEFFWEPVAGCWTVHHRSKVRAASADGSGEWVIDYEVPNPEPAPVTTIAWRTVHIAAVNYLYWDYAFGPATASFDLEMPGNAAAAADWLRASQQPLRTVLAELDEADLETPRKTNWGELWPCHRIFSTLINEQVHHGAEISLLRDLYRCRESLGSRRGGVTQP
jgi:DinB superfamily